MKKLYRFLLPIFCFCVAFGATKAWLYLRDNKMSNFETCAEVYIYPTTTAEEAMTMIADSAGVKSIKSLKRAFKDKQVSEYIQPGHYIINPEYSSVYVARMLNNCWQSPVKMTLAGTMRLKGVIAKKISSQLMMDSLAVHNALEDEEFLKSYGFTPQNVFSLIMPATYEMYWTASIKDVFDKQKAAYDAYWTEERLAAAKELGLSKEEVSILASIVKGETNYEPEMPKIAGVYLNRLAIGMKLQADPTIVFCYDYSLDRVLRKHLQVDSPYNTYKHYGLPPGPIAVPTKACLDAVLYPDFGGTAEKPAPRGSKGNLYFCASPDFNGSHLFAHSYSEHLRNARAFQRALTLRNQQKK